MYHSRLNGKSVFDFKYPGNGWPTSEVLAWNWSESMLMGIEQWYSEKDAYVKGTPGAVTGHYTSMIKPANRYVGVGTFINKNASYPNTTAAQFMGSGSQAETMAKSTGESDVTVEVQKDNITSVKMTGNKNVQEGQKITLTLKAVLGQYGSIEFRYCKGVIYRSGNRSQKGNCEDHSHCWITFSIIYGNSNRKMCACIFRQGSKNSNYQKRWQGVTYMQKMRPEEVYRCQEDKESYIITDEI